MSRTRNAGRLASWWHTGLPGREVVELTVERGPEPEYNRPTAAGPVDALRHGYTMADLHRLASVAVARDRLMASDWTDRYETAWSAIATHLYEVDEPPSGTDLIRVGWHAIYSEVATTNHHHGYDPRGNSQMPRFALYWQPENPTFVDRIVESIALHQVSATLTRGGREAILALAVHEDYQTAADALGIEYKALIRRLQLARNRFVALWHEGETPYRRRRIDRRAFVRGVPLPDTCAAGHEWTPENTRMSRRLENGRYRKHRQCRECNRLRRAAARAVRVAAEAVA